MILQLNYFIKMLPFTDKLRYSIFHLNGKEKKRQLKFLKHHTWIMIKFHFKIGKSVK